MERLTKLLRCGSEAKVKLCPSRSFASSTASTNNGNPVKTSRHKAAMISRRPMGPFLKRTEGVKNMLDHLATLTTWDDIESPKVLTSLSVPFHPYIISEVIRKCSHAEIALCLFRWLCTRDDFHPDNYIYNSLIYRLGKAGNFTEMENIAELAISSRKATVVTFTTLISGFRNVMDLEKAIRAWNKMKELGIKPCTTTYTAMIDLYASMKMFDEAGNLYMEILKEDLRPSIRTCTVLMNHLVQAGKLDAAVEIFHGLLKVKLRPNAVTYATIMLGYAKAGDMETVIQLIRDFKEYGHSPDSIGQSFISLLQYLVNENKIEDAEMVLAEGWPQSTAVERKQKIIEFKSSSLGQNCSPMSLGIKEDDSNSDSEGEHDGNDSDEEAFLSYRQSDSSTLINVVGFVRCLVPWTSATVKALDNAKLNWDCHVVSEVLNRLRKADSGWKFYCWVAKQPGYSHDRYTCHRMIKLLLKVGGFSRVRIILKEAQKERLVLSMHTYNSILKHCGLQKQADFALEVFDLLKESGSVPDEACYKYLIHSLVKCGRYWRVATICAEMQKAGLSLDETTYSLLISAFAEAGKFVFVKKLIKQMRKIGFQPNVFVYNALIRGYYGVGKFDKAIKIFKSMRKADMAPTQHIFEIMIQVYSSMGDLKEVSKLKDEIKAVLSPSGAARRARKGQYIRFQTIFIENIMYNEKLQLSAAG